MTGIPWSERYPNEGSEMNERENDQEYADGWTEETKQEYEEWLREQDSIPPWRATYDDFLESQK